MTPRLPLYFPHSLKMNPIFQWNEAQQITENKFQCSSADNLPRSSLMRVLDNPVCREICLLNLDLPHFIVIPTRSVGFFKGFFQWTIEGWTHCFSGSEKLKDTQSLRPSFWKHYPLLIKWQKTQQSQLLFSYLGLRSI